MKTINYTFTEELLEPYGITVEELADANGYNPLLPNPDFIPAVGQPTLDDPSGEMEDHAGVMLPKQIPNPDFVPAVGEPTIPNISATEYVATLIPKMGMEGMIEKALAPKVAELKRALKDLEKQPAIIAEAIVENLTKNVTE